MFLTQSIAVFFEVAQRRNDRLQRVVRVPGAGGRNDEHMRAAEARLLPTGTAFFAAAHVVAGESDKSDDARSVIRNLLFE